VKFSGSLIKLSLFYKFISTGQIIDMKFCILPLYIQQKDNREPCDVVEFINSRGFFVLLEIHFYFQNESVKSIYDPLRYVVEINLYINMFFSTQGSDRALLINLKLVGVVPTPSSNKSTC